MRHDAGMGDVEYDKIYAFDLPPAFLRLYEGPAVNVQDMWRIVGKSTSIARGRGLVVGTIIKTQARPAVQALQRGLLCLLAGR